MSEREELRRLCALLNSSEAAYMWVDGVNSIIRHSVLDQYVTALSPDVVLDLLNTERALREENKRLEAWAHENDNAMFERFANRLATFYKNNGGDGYLGGEGEESGDVMDWCAACAEHVATHFINERDELQERMDRIKSWCNAYPLSVFPEPDMTKAAEALKAAGLTLDAVSASNMRHVLKGVAEIAAAEGK